MGSEAYAVVVQMSVIAAEVAMVMSVFGHVSIDFRGEVRVKLRCQSRDGGGSAYSIGQPACERLETVFRAQMELRLPSFALMVIYLSNRIDGFLP